MSDQPDVKVTIVKAAPSTALSSNVLEVEDDFVNLYEGPNSDSNIMQPSFSPTRLQRLAQENNALGQCIEAMEVNIDGTGYDIILDPDGDVETLNEDEQKRLMGFFKEPYPGESFISMRRQVRVDLETIGYGYLEVIRNPHGEVTFVRYAEAAYIRMIKLDEPIEAKKEIIRNGKAVSISMAVRERAFVQKIGNSMTYFREFGTSRDIHKVLGTWSEQGQRLPAKDRGTELIMFKSKKAPASPYPIPRWLAQLPSVLGSRKAEELNLDYFDAGGVPPALIFLNGGAFSEAAHKALTNVLSGGAKSKMRVAVCEVQPTGGDINTSSGASTEVVKFGQEMVSDSMFEGYDDKCERRVRGSLRLPPLFVGKAEDYSYSTAFASYAVAEAQVFKPERDEFDQIINVTLMRGLGASDLIFKSNVLAIHDAVIQLKAVDMAGEEITGEEKVKSLNNISSLSMDYDAEGEAKREERKDAEAAAPVVVSDEEEAVDGKPRQGEDNLEGESTPSKPAKLSKASALLNLSKVDLFELAGLAGDMARALGLEDGPEMSEEAKTSMYDRVHALAKEDHLIFDAFFASRTMQSAGADEEDLTRISSHARNLMER